MKHNRTPPDRPTYMNQERKLILLCVIIASVMLVSFVRRIFF